MGKRAGLLNAAPVALAQVLDRPPPVINDPLKDATRLTSPWTHGELHDHLSPMEGHVIITYYGDAQDIVWRRGNERLSGTTRSGTVTIIPEGHEGRWDIAGPIDVSHVFLSSERLAQSAELLLGSSTVELVPRVGFADPISARIMEMLGREAATLDASSRLFAEQATDLLVTQLLRGHSSQSSLQAPPKRGLADWQVRKVTDYMLAHLDQPIGLDLLADLVGLSRFHFCTAFKLATGATPHKWLVKLRMERAQKLIATTDLPMIQIALAVGYETPSAFSATFRKCAGLTPSEFRKRR